MDLTLCDIDLMDLHLRYLERAGVASYGIDGTPAIESPPGGGLAVGEPAFEETVPDLVGLPTAVPDPRATQSSVRYV